MPLQIRIIVVIGSVLIVSTSEYFFAHRPKRNLSLEKQQYLIENILFYAISSLFPLDYKNFRASVMLPVKSWKFWKEKELQIFASFNMEDFPAELKIKYKIRQGSAGMAWYHNQELIADLTRVSISEWGLNPIQQQLTKDVKGVYSIPIRYPGNQKKVIGILNIDTMLSDKVGELREEYVGDAVKNLALVLATIL
jgi:hypothetical protein